jgi:hypothetical protein
MTVVIFKIKKELKLAGNVLRRVKAHLQDVVKRPLTDAINRINVATPDLTVRKSRLAPFVVYPVDVLNSLLIAHSLALLHALSFRFYLCL